MRNIIYSGSFNCELCGGPQIGQVYGSDGQTLDDYSKERIHEMWSYHHWCLRHRNCAVCGEFVRPDDLELAVNDGKIKIHEAYTEYYKRKIKPGDLHAGFLYVHSTCLL